MTEDKIAALEARLAELERRAAALQAAGVPRWLGACAVRDECQRLGLWGARFRRAPSDYYDRPLEWRAEFLGCRTEQLCKTIVVHNRAHRAEADAAPRYLAVVVQYISAFNADRIAAVMRRRFGLPRKALMIRVAENGEELTGFEHNAVAPFGGKVRLPIVLAEAVAKLEAFWIGGGDPDVKLRVSTREFVRGLGEGVWVEDV